jgi:hypothetical protein
MSSSSSDDKSNDIVEAVDETKTPQKYIYLQFVSGSLNGTLKEIAVSILKLLELRKSKNDVNVDFLITTIREEITTLILTQPQKNTKNFMYSCNSIFKKYMNKQDITKEDEALLNVLAVLDLCQPSETYELFKASKFASGCQVRLEPLKDYSVASIQIFQPDQEAGTWRDFQVVHTFDFKENPNIDLKPLTKLLMVLGNLTQKIKSEIIKNSQSYITKAIEQINQSKKNLLEKRKQETSSSDQTEQGKNKQQKPLE